LISVDLTSQQKSGSVPFVGETASAYLLRHQSQERDTQWKSINNTAPMMSVLMLERPIMAISKSTVVKSNVTTAQLVVRDSANRVIPFFTNCERHVKTFLKRLPC
jgi:hypothetical protein